MSEEVKRLRERLLRLPPTCIAGFRVQQWGPPEEGFWCPTAFWLKCRCGSEMGRILGHPLGDYHPTCAHPAQFVSPLGFKCPRCQKITEVIDTDRHGYHGMLGDSAVIRGRGRRRTFRCPTCNREELSLIVTFVYSEGVFDALRGEPVKKIKDYFSAFQAHAFCGDCCEWPFVAGFDL